MRERRAESAQPVGPEELLAVDGEGSVAGHCLCDALGGIVARVIGLLTCRARRVLRYRRFRSDCIERGTRDRLGDGSCARLKRSCGDRGRSGVSSSMAAMALRNETSDTRMSVDLRGLRWRWRRSRRVCAINTAAPRAQPQFILALRTMVSWSAIDWRRLAWKRLQGRKRSWVGAETSNMTHGLAGKLRVNVIYSLLRHPLLLIGSPDSTSFDASEVSHFMSDPALHNVCWSFTACFLGLVATSWCRPPIFRE